ncbi:MAG: DUF3822 family protein [Candidatus Azobacteroides sp.]|nr:DUF3822 family protein [Candidatus Azobacteroides sp.]
MESKIDLNDPGKYRLLIRLQSPEEASFYIYSADSPEIGKYISLPLPKTSLFTENLKDAVFMHEELSLPYQQTDILVVNGFYTFVPEEVYAENINNKDFFLHFNFEEDTKNKKVLTNKINICKIENLFGVRKEEYEFLQRTFPDARYIHHITPLLQFFLKLRIIGEHGRVYVNLNNNDISVFCFRSNRIEAVNSYACNNINDAAYFILTLWDKLKFDQLSDGLHIAGIPEKKAELIPVLSRFIENVTPISNPLGGENHLTLPFDLQALLLNPVPVTKES